MICLVGELCVVIEKKLIIKNFIEDWDIIGFLKSKASIAWDLLTLS